MKILDRLEEWIIATLMAGATLVVFFAVVHRYLQGLAIPGVQEYLISLNTSWAQELCIYMGVWMAKFGAAYGVRTGIHVGVDVLVNRLSEKNRLKMVTFSLLAGATFTAIIGTLGAIFVYKMAQTSSTSPDMEIPSWIVYMAIPLGSYLMCFRFLQVLVHFWRTGDLPRHDHTYVEGVDKEIDTATGKGIA